MHNKGLTTPGSGIPLGFTTIAQKLKTAGYSTHAVGKYVTAPCVGIFKLEPSPPYPFRNILP
jgi:hypothetical protein